MGTGHQIKLEFDVKTCPGHRPDPVCFNNTQRTVLTLHITSKNPERGTSTDVIKLIPLTQNVSNECPVAPAIQATLILSLIPRNIRALIVHVPAWTDPQGSSGKLLSTRIRRHALFLQMLPRVFNALGVALPSRRSPCFVARGNVKTRRQMAHGCRLVAGSGAAKFHSNTTLTVWLCGN